MDKDLARLVISTALKSASALNEILPLLSERASDDEYKTFLTGIAAVNYEISHEILNRIFKSFPDLERETEERFLQSGIGLANTCGRPE